MSDCIRDPEYCTICWQTCCNCWDDELDEG